MPGPNYNMNDSNARRVRKGMIEGYVEYLDEDDIKYIREKCNKLFTNEVKWFFSQYNISV